MDIKILDEQGVEKTQEEVKEPVNEQPYKLGELLVPQIAEMFNLNPNELTENKAKLNTVLDYAKTQTDDHTAEGLKWAIRKLQDRVGTPPLGQKWLPYLAEYAFVAMETTKWNEKMESFERNRK